MGTEGPSQRKRSGLRKRAVVCRKGKIILKVREREKEKEN